jgi:hypothetical protein
MIARLTSTLSYPQTSALIVFEQMTAEPSKMTICPPISAKEAPQVDAMKAIRAIEPDEAGMRAE